MFNFFRKDKPEDFMAFLKEGQQEFAAGPSYTLMNSSESQEDGGIQVQEAVGGMAPELEEAAILYANGKVGEAASQLNRYLLEHPDSRDTQPWFMLFDLYEASNQPAPFDDAAVEFAVKFERSPPTWAPRGQFRASTSPAPLMSFGEKFGNIEKVKLERFFQDAKEAPFVRLDVTKSPAPAEEAARAMLDCCTRMEKLAKPVELLGGPGFAVRLAAAQQGDRLSEQGWLLWLAALRLLGKQDDYENAAVDYAVAFEVSPPSYTPPLPLPERGETAEVETPRGASDALRLSGVIGPGSEIRLSEISRYAEGRKRVEIDLSEVSRIDFTAVGLLLETLMEITQGGRKVVFKEGNELVNALLHIVGVSSFAGIQGRTRI